MHIFFQYSQSGFSKSNVGGGCFTALLTSTSTWPNLFTVSFIIEDTSLGSDISALNEKTSTPNSRTVVSFFGFLWRGKIVHYNAYALLCKQTRSFTSNASTRSSYYIRLKEHVAFECRRRKIDELLLLANSFVRQLPDSIG